MNLHLHVVLDRKCRPAFLTDAPDDYAEDPGYATRAATAADLTPALVADYLDQRAEDVNAHDFVGAHRALAVLLRKTVGGGAAAKVMRKLLEFEGLHGLTGVCGAGDSAKAEKYLGYKP
jgi:hypothetical protein